MSEQWKKGETIADRLRIARERGGYSQGDLSQKTGMKQSAISHFECGRREPSAGSLRKLAVALCVTADWILGIGRIRSNAMSKERPTLSHPDESSGLFDEADDMYYRADLKEREILEKRGWKSHSRLQGGSHAGGCPEPMGRCLQRKGTHSMTTHINAITREQTTTPKNPPREYDWTKEPWVKEDEPSGLDHHLAMSILVALAADGDTPRETEDETVFLLMNPGYCERVFKSPAAAEIIRFRVAHAIAQHIKMVRDRWIKSYGSIDAKGAP